MTKQRGCLGWNVELGSLACNMLVVGNLKFTSSGIPPHAVHSHPCASCCMQVLDLKRYYPIRYNLSRGKELDMQTIWVFVVDTPHHTHVPWWKGGNRKNLSLPLPPRILIIQAPFPVLLLRLLLQLVPVLPSALLLTRAPLVCACIVIKLAVILRALI